MLSTAGKREKNNNKKTRKEKKAVFIAPSNSPLLNVTILLTLHSKVGKTKEKEEEEEDNQRNKNRLL